MKKIFRYIKLFSLCCIFFGIFLVSGRASAPVDRRYVERYIAESLYLRLERIDLSGFECRGELVFDALDYVIKTNPELYYVGESFYYSANKDGFVTEIIPNYIYNKKETKNIKSFCDREIEKILFSVDEGMDDFTKALVLHEYLCDSFTYDDSLENYTMFELLRDGRGTCQAFTLTYMELLRRVGIESTYAYSNEIMHIWNVVELDGKWYHVDVTWDNARDGVLHTSFLLTDSEILENGHVGAVIPLGVECTDTKYSGLYLRCVPYKYERLGDGFVFADNVSRGVYFDKLDGGEPELLHRIDGLWKKAEGRFYANSFVSVVRAGDRVYFNTKNSIMEIDGSLKVSELVGIAADTYGIGESDVGLCLKLDRNGESTQTLVINRSMDADGDGEVSVLDIAALSRYIHDKSGDIYKYNVDVNGDRALDCEDLEGLENRILA